MQTSFSELKYAAKKKVRLGDRCQSQIESVPPRATLVPALQSYYPKSNKRNRPSIAPERKE